VSFSIAPHEGSISARGTGDDAAESSTVGVIRAGTRERVGGRGAWTRRARGAGRGRRRPWTFRRPRARGGRARGGHGDGVCGRGMRAEWRIGWARKALAGNESVFSTLAVMTRDS